MNTFLRLISCSVMAASLLFATSRSQAQQVTLRVEPGIAVPVTEPQSSRFGVGGALAVKPELGLTPYLSVGPSVSVVSLPSSVSGVDAGTLWGFGLFGRVKRPHDASNTGTGFSAASPWVDADVQYVYTNPLSRFGWTLGAGVSVPTSSDRDLWVGPFVRYQGVVQGEKVGFNSNDAKILIFGVSFEIGPKAAKKEVPAKPVVEPCPQLPVVEKPVPVPVVENVELELKQVIQFAWDSPKLDDKANAQLTAAVKKIVASKSFGAIKIEGHASSEGQVEHNNVLAKKRAQSVADFLVAHGIPKDKLTVTGFGSSVPVATNKTEAGKVLNRRAEFVVKIVVVKEGK